MNKKIYAIMLAVIFTASVQAQFTFGVRGGFNLTNMDESGEGISPDTKMKPGFQVGIVGDYAVNESFSIQPALLFATQGCNWDFELFGTKVETSINLNYLQVPVNAQYKLDLGNAKPFLQAGPYVGYALSGKIKAKADGFKNDEKIEFGNGEDDMNPFDFGLGFGAGVQFENIQVGLGYNLGLANLSNADKITTRNNGLTFTLTYLFGR